MLRALAVAILFGIGIGPMVGRSALERHARQPVPMGLSAPVAQSEAAVTGRR
jgi:hypothetical protein